ncbi:hypothetical protein PIB30_058234 [Stylosanthes scabra]|uniref:Uncharacterized protein n=1 Tax=Stylosanthes scabra TaxID=79078 RepID=A0ABU6UMX6_9FABA|nr:hypothetical protein [Stylosanthes scabra]
MNCAPSQLHSNSWAFIKAFEILMEFLRCQPSFGFFSMFQAKGVRKGEKAPKLTSGSMKAFFRQRASRKEGFVYEACKDVCGEVTKTSHSIRNISMKRRKAECVININDKTREVPEKGKEKIMAIDEVEKTFKSQQSLHGYKGNEDLSSL